MNKAKNILLIGFLLLLAFFSGVYYSQIITKNLNSKSSDLISKIEKREKGYIFIDPLLECEYENSQGNTSLKGIKETTQNILDKYPDYSISLYYRDLSNGPWYGIGENDNFAPQSLLKLPVAISYLKMSELNSSILQTKIPYIEPIESNLKPEEDLILGESYEVEFLINRILKLSDNIAFNLLASNIPKDQLLKTHEDLGIVYPSNETPTDFVSVRSYSSLFRVLYNSSYLYRQNSEYLLKILSETEFKDGLVAGLPKEVLVSHKFGILNKESEIKQLHDCGIVYATNKPYILCVMTKGKDLEELKIIIKEISGAIYQSVITPS